MGVEKCRAARGELIKVRRLRQGMPTEVTNPVVLIIDGDE
jgi:hypothetical protein